MEKRFLYIKVSVTSHLIAPLQNFDLNTVVKFDDYYGKDYSNLCIDGFPIDGLPEGE